MSPCHQSSSLALLFYDSSTPSAIKALYPSLAIDLLGFPFHILTLPSELIIDLPPLDTTHAYHMLTRSKTESLKPWAFSTHTLIILLEPKSFFEAKGISKWEEIISKEFQALTDNST